jgi:Glutaredoxin-like domain (DUF836)
MHKVRIYSRPGCHLCERLIEEIQPLGRGRAEIEVLNIDSRPDWRAKFDQRVPVVEIDRQVVCQYTLDRKALLRALDDIEAQ